MAKHVIIRENSVMKCRAFCVKLSGNILVTPTYSDEPAVYICQLLGAYFMARGT